MKAAEFSPADKASTRTTRLNLNLSEQARADLDRLASKAGCTISELVRFGLMLVKLYYDAPPGEKLAMVKEKGPITLIMPPWGPK